MLPSSKAPLVLLTVAVVIAIIALLLPPIPQPLAYHSFADQRPWRGIPNFGDVVSNLPFAIVGLCGLIFLLKPHPEKFSDPRERWLYLVMFAALILTAFGSAYYHLAPGNSRLVWDRIPIMIVFMALLAAVIAERVSVVAGLWLFPLLQVAGIGSVLAWRAGELRGHGDLRFYAAVQVYSILVLLLLLTGLGQVHTRLRSRRSSRLLPVGQNSGRVGPPGLHPGPPRQRPHAEAPGRRHSRLFDSEDVEEEGCCFLRSA